MRGRDRCVPREGTPLTTATRPPDLDAVPCGLLQTSDDGTIRWTNKTFAGWIGISAAALVGRRFQDLLTIGGKIFHHTHWAPLLRMQGSISEVKLELVHGEQVIPVVLNAIRHEDASGVTVHDIASYVARDRDRYEQELIRSRRRLEDTLAELNTLHAAAKDRALFAEQMMGIVSHDLRNPLGAIHIGCELLASGSLTEAQQRTLTRIMNSATRATHLIDDLLDFASARVGRGLSVTIADMRLHDVVADAIDELHVAYRGRTLVHQRVGTGSTRGDARRLTQLLGNLVSNAMVYGEPGSAVTVRSHANETSAIEVHSEGPAISPVVLSNLFEPMTRGTAGGAPRSVGLGLFIVREIAHAHGGRASVSSTVAGTTFRVEWPSVTGIA